MFHGTIVTFCTNPRGVIRTDYGSVVLSSASTFPDYTQATLQSEPPLQNAQNKGFKKMLIRCYQL